jgi:glycerol-3-phosphate cytidylyltransferase
MEVGFTASTFDLLHAGHIAMLRDAKSQCNHLICGLQIDPSCDRMDKNKPIQSIVERYTQLSAVKYVDEIIVYATENDLIDILQMYPINIRILGEEYRNKDFTGKDECRQLGIDLYFNERNHRFSSSGLRKRIMDNEQSIRTDTRQRLTETARSTL